VQVTIEVDPEYAADNLSDLGFLQQWSIEGIDPVVLEPALSAVIGIHRKRVV
jgi:hypothetical protein